MAVFNEEDFTALCNSLGAGESTPWNVAVSWNAPNTNTTDLPAAAVTLDVKASPERQPVAISRYTPPMQEKIGSTRRKLLERLEKRRMTAIPDCLKNKENAEIYIALIDYALCNWITDSRRAEITQSVVNINNHVWTEQSPQQGESIILLAVTQLNVSRLLAALIIGDLISMKPENCFCRFPQSKNEHTENCGRGTLGRFPNILVAGDIVFKLERTYPIRSVGGHVLQVACRYVHDNEAVTVYSDASMQIGTTDLTAYLPAVDFIDSMPEATIHLCLCPDVLWGYLDLARERNLAHRAGVVVTGCFGGLNDFDALDISPIIFHHVVLICSPDRQEWSGIEHMAKRCIAHGASSVKFYPWPLMA